MTSATSTPAADISSTKHVLLFTSYFDMKTWGMPLGRDAFSRCPVSNCRLTNDRTDMPSISDYDAVLFHLRDVNTNVRRVAVPNQRKRRPSQRYVMFLMESPQHDGFKYSKFKNFFNWTMTYRLDSDIPHPYGRVVEKEGADGFSYVPYLSEVGQWKHKFDRDKFVSSLSNRSEEFRALARRPKAVAWIVSNCAVESDRESYVRELRKYIQVSAFSVKAYT